MSQSQQVGLAILPSFTLRLYLSSSQDNIIQKKKHTASSLYYLLAYKSLTVLKETQIKANMTKIAANSKVN